jgi:uncharacterized DUF497 family protein
MEFEWDEEKRLRNIVAHGVDFREAALVFRMPTLEAEDRRGRYGEVRIRALGHVDESYFLVVYTRRGEVRRIISAWRVGEDGKKRYQAALAR